MITRFLPGSLFVLTCLSLLISSTIFATSFHTFGVLSLFLNTISTGLTLIYHIVIITISWRRTLYPLPTASAQKTPSSIAYTATSIASLFCILVMLVVALVLEIQATSNGAQDHQLPMGHNSQLNMALQIALCTLLLVEVLVVMAILVHGIGVRGQVRAKPTVDDYDNWLFLPSPSPLSTLGTVASSVEKAEPLFIPPTIPQPRTIHLKQPVPKFRRDSITWSYLTPGSASMLFETPIKTKANCAFR